MVGELSTLPEMLSKAEQTLDELEGTSEEAW